MKCRVLNRFFKNYTTIIVYFLQQLNILSAFFAFKRTQAFSCKKCLITYFGALPETLESLHDPAYTFRGSWKPIEMTAILSLLIKFHFCTFVLEFYICLKRRH